MQKKNTYIDFAISVAERAGKKLLNDFYKTERIISSKTTGGIVTPYDMRSDAYIRKEIKKQFPSHSYLTEETGFVDNKSEYLWVIDPLDGTGNFVNHDPFFAVSIALFKNGIPVIGVIEAPALHERYSAEKGKGAFIVNTLTNKKYQAHTSNVRTFAQAFVLYCKGGEERSVMIKDVKTITERALYVRRSGSAAIDMSAVGMGRADAFVSTHLSLWDIAAAGIFVTEAGGTVIGFKPKSRKKGIISNQNQVSICATNGKFSPRVITRLL
jgi:myo-inositol-1(or 4)-monophosphatase